MHSAAVQKWTLNVKNLATNDPRWQNVCWFTCEDKSREIAWSKCNLQIRFHRKVSLFLEIPQTPLRYAKVSHCAENQHDLFIPFNRTPAIWLTNVWLCNALCIKAALAKCGKKWSIKTGLTKRLEWKEVWENWPLLRLKRKLHMYRS